LIAGANVCVPVVGVELQQALGAQVQFELPCKSLSVGPVLIEQLG
jgi:hypothetical protein